MNRPLQETSKTGGSRTVTGLPPTLAYPQQIRHYSFLPFIYHQGETMQYFALTIIDHDRPGIVARVTEILYRLGRRL